MISGKFASQKINFPVNLLPEDLFLMNKLLSYVPEGTRSCQKKLTFFKQVIENDKFLDIRWCHFLGTRLIFSYFCENKGRSDKNVKFIWYQRGVLTGGENKVENPHNGPSV